MGAAATGVVLTVINVKVVAACAAAGYIIGSSPLNAAGIAGAVTYFTLVGGSTAAVPILGYAVWTHRIDRFLTAFRDWMQRRQRVLTLIVLVNRSEFDAASFFEKDADYVEALPGRAA
jgi:hypothetical protein